MKKKLLIFIVGILSLFMAVGCKKTTKTEVPIKDDGISIHTDLQEAYLKDDYDNFSKYATGVENLSTPKPVVLTFGEDVIALSNNYTVYLSESNTFTTYKTYESTTTSVSIYNLKIHTEYFWKVNNGSVESATFNFTTTSKGPRNINAGELTNVRDLGGWEIEGGYVNQGLMYRTSKFNADESTELLINQDGINVFVNELGVKTEIDLRKVTENGDITTSPLGNKVSYIFIPMNSSGNILTLNPDEIVQVFKVFANRDNYPICFHCSIGTDRTGLIAFLVNALCGVKEADLYRDYLFSNFGNIGSMRTPSAIKDYIKKINLKSGKTLQEKTFNYLIDLGLTEAELNNVIDIMTK